MNTPQEFAPLLAGLRRLADRNFAGGAAMATLTRTRGSTFRRPGARMLVGGDGHVVRGLSGGCPEQDIVARAQRVIAAGQPEIVRYNAEYGLDALIEMGCGGELEVLIEPIAGPDDLRFVDAVERCLSTRTPGLLATAFARDGHCIAPRPRRLVWAEGIASDGFDDPLLSEAVLAQGLAGYTNRAVVERIDTADGVIDVLIEKLQPPHALLLIGVSAAALALARIGETLGWAITLVNHRAEAPPPELPASARWMTAAPAQLMQQLRTDRHSSAVVMTHNLDRDIAYLQALREAPLAYLGAIGSRARSAKLRAGSGLAAPQLRAPAGLDLGSETPEEIALAIAAEILAVAAGRDGGMLSATDRPIH